VLLVLGLGLKARSKLVTLALNLSGLGREGLAWFSLFGRYINPDTPSDSGDMRVSSAGVLPEHYQLDQFTSTEDNMASLCYRSEFSVGLIQ